MTATPDLDFNLGINLDDDRQRRAAEREVQAETLPIRLGGETVAQIPVELPLDVLSPLRRLDEEITLLLRTVLDVMRQGGDAGERLDAAALVIDILAANPSLPSTALDVVTDMATALFGKEGFDRLMAQRPSNRDMAYLGTSLMKFYGLSLGESRPLSDSSTAAVESGGATSKPTSPTTTTDSTPAESSVDPAPPASSEPAAS